LFYVFKLRLIDNEANLNGSDDEILLSTNTSNFVALEIRTSINTSLNTGIPPSVGNT
jgi:hypothetical protein